ncbi:MAG: MarR family transcriptional regulator [Planctomycetota bacterium]
MKRSLQSQLKKQQPFEVPQEELNLNVQRTCSVLIGPFHKLLKQHKLSLPLYNILRILRGSGCGLPCSEIGDRMVTRESDVTRLLDRLEKLGCVRRERAIEDRRVVNIVLTPAGKKLVDKLDEPIIELHRETLGHLSKREMADLNRLLMKARAAIEE